MGAKSDLLEYLEELYEAQECASFATCCILDGTAIVQMLKPVAAKTFQEYATEIFIPYLSKSLQNVSRLDVVRDTYIAGSLKCKKKTGERSSSTCGSCRHHTGKLAELPL